MEIREDQNCNANSLIPSFYLILVHHVRYNKNLEPNAKLFFATLTSLTQSCGYCWASNKYLAELCDVDIRTIQRWIESLKEEGYIEIHHENDGIKHIRKIYIRLDIKINSTSRHFCQGGGDKNVTQNNISKNNNIKVNTTCLPKEAVPASCHAPSAPDVPKKKIEKFSDEAKGLAEFFFQILQHEKPHIKPPNLSAWAAVVDKMIRLDKRNAEEIRTVMLWVIGHDFWHANILSPEKLRKHYDRLLAQMEQEKNYNGKYKKQKKYSEGPKKFFPGDEISKDEHRPIDPEKLKKMLEDL